MVKRKIIWLFLVLFLTNPCFSAVKIWAGADGNWAAAANWSPSGVPANADDVYLEDASQSITAGFNQSAVALTSLNISRTFTGYVGDSNGYLQIGATTVNIGYYYGKGTPAGSGRIKLDLGAVDSTVTISYSAASTDTNKHAIRLKANDANTIIHCLKGDVGLATDTNEVSTVGTINIGWLTNQGNDCDVEIGSGVTLTTLNKTGGECTLQCAATTVNCDYGDLSTAGTGAITTATIKGGKLISNSTGTITALNVIENGQADFSLSNAARTVTTAKVGDSGWIKYDPSVLTLTNKIQHYDTAGIVEIGAL